MNGNETNLQLELAREYVQNTSMNVFLTGKAGTGKTTFLHSIVKDCTKRKIVVAPTGVAAINAGGVTMHSFFQIPFGVYLPEFNRFSGQDKKEYRKLSSVKLSIIRSLELMIIDEISMLRADVLDSIDAILKRVRRNGRPFGGVQVLMIGDMQQLPPVAKDEEWDVLKEYYKSPFFFDSKVLAGGKYVCIELTKIYRQRDEVFIDLLAKVRENRIDRKVLDLLNSRFMKDFEPEDEEGYIRLTTHNSSARQINDRKMEELDSEEYRFNASIQGEFPDYMYPMDEVLILKKGAQVMFVKNDPTPAKEYVNGTLGVVTDISEEMIEVTPFPTGGSFADSDAVPITVPLDTWENQRYTIDKSSKEIVSTIVGMFTQYPVKPAWAITIHKSQGLTFEKAIIDAANSFTHGQVYVALSRCKSMEGLVLSSKIGYSSVMNDYQISEFNDRVEEMQPDEHTLAEDKKAYFKGLLGDLCDFSYIAKQYFILCKFLTDTLSNTYPNLLEQMKVSKEPLKNEIEAVGVKFVKSLDKIVGDDYDTSPFLRERISKASQYFLDKMVEIVIPTFSSASDLEIDNADDKKFYKAIVQNLASAIYVKVTLLRYSVNEFELSDYLKIKAKAEVDAVDKKFKKTVTTTDAPQDILNKELFNHLREWRNSKAKSNNAPAYTVLHQKALIAICNSKPCDEGELLAINGIGKKFIEKYGEELLEVLKKW